jgi:uncharacterized metal-binding protein
VSVCLQYCHGLRNPVSTAARLACYLVVEQTLGPNHCVLGCGPALEAGVEEDVKFVREYPTVAVEACAEACTGRLLARWGVPVAGQVFADQVLAAQGFDVHSLTHGELHLDHPAVVALAEEITRVAQEVLRRGAREREASEAPPRS